MGSAGASSRLLVALTVAVPLVLGGLALLLLRSGTAARSEGLPTVARVARLGEGSCTFGATHEHCLRLWLEVLPDGEAAFDARLDVLVPDRFASRVQPGAYVWVVRDPQARQEVALALEAFAEPAPKAPAASP